MGTQVNFEMMLLEKVNAISTEFKKLQGKLINEKKKLII